MTCYEDNRVVFCRRKAIVRLRRGRTFQPIPGRRLVLTVFEGQGGKITRAHIGDKLVVGSLDLFAAVAVVLLLRVVHSSDVFQRKQ